MSDQRPAWKHKDPAHPFFQAANIAKLMDLIDTKVTKTIGAPYRHQADDSLSAHIHWAVDDYPELLLRHDGADRFNEVVANRVVDQMTEPDEVGMYWRGNAFYKPSRAGKKAERDGTNPLGSHQRVTLSGNMYRGYLEEYWKDELASRAAHDRDGDRFERAFATWEDQARAAVPTTGARKVRMR